MKSIKLLGDPHLGRTFTNNVPLHRRGERERMQWSRFRDSLEDVDDVTHHICMGDLFDKSTVSNETLLKAIKVYSDAAFQNPQVMFIVLRGNHDINRDLTGASAFDIFDIAMGAFTNVLIVKDEPLQIDDMAFFGWNPTVSSIDLVTGYLDTDCPVDTVFGHWDVDPRTGPHNLIPTEALAHYGVKQAYTGHIHKPEHFTRDGVDVHVVGSMMPYAFGEESDDTLFATLTLSEFEEKDPDWLRSRVIRVRLQPGEDPPDTPDCLQFSWDRVRTAEDAVEVGLDLTIEQTEFRLSERLQAVLTEHNVPDKVTTQIKERLSDLLTEV